MTLLEFRKLFVQLSGRYDLVEDTDSYKDNGANFYIRAGNRMLDNKFTHSKSYGTTDLSLEQNKAVYDIPSMLSIEGVILITADEGRVTLKHVEEQKIKELDPTEEEATGTPRMYAIATTVRDAVLGNLESNLSQLAIRIYPAPEETGLTAEVYGRVTIGLQEDSDQNFWTRNYPETLVSAALYTIERFHRNRQGMQDHMVAIMEDLRELDANAIESQMGSINQMRDSFKFRGEGNEW